MTTYKNNGETITLDRTAVERFRSEQIARAIKHENRGDAYISEFESRSEWRERQVSTARAIRADVVRLTAVLACIDAGMAELPEELHPGH